MTYFGFWSVLVSAVVLFTQFVGAEETGSGVTRPQPIGIDFADTFVTASYAHAKDNITLLAAVSAKDEPYEQHLFLLRWEDPSHKYPSRISKSVKPSEWIRLFIVTKAQNCLDWLVRHIPFQDHPAATAIKNSGTGNWIQTMAEYVFGAAKALYLKTKGDTLSLEMTHEEIKDGFISLLKRVKEQALENRNTTITFAVLSLPDYFNDTIRAIAGEACREVGIQAISPVPRTTMGVWGAEIAHDDDTRVLILDHGKYHLTMRTYQTVRNRSKPLLQRYLSIDIFASATLDRELVNRVIETDAILKKQINSGANRARLREAIETARPKIKGSIDQLFARANDGSDNEDYNYNEWPLNIKDWWHGMEGSAVLRWEDVEYVEEEYVKNLAQTIKTFLVTLPMGREHSKKEDLDPEDIDAAVILTTGIDGDLLKRAINKALGREVNIIGGSFTDVILAANGAALVALKVLHSWEEEQESRDRYSDNFEHHEL
ncbi:hypothetical protein OIDMADRAFT_178682 [Oidiodendron maius Zn]|uniref:Uncharacterized protein n=1 Tax=Oidiodendron maius (strain Zn) TaxID=913774 RepID=A0A0C3DLF3_OIDMZ|nr:hypothetical protein OIDMADRAFT_178682 [Oidiodendron maius Zn]